MKLTSDTTMLYLVRHGATEANEQVPYILQGNSVDLPLSDTGRRQAIDTGRLLSDQPLVGVYSSRLKRAIETAERIAEPHGLSVQQVAGIEECDVGEWERLDWESIRAKYPEEYRRFQEQPYDAHYLKGESYRNVFERAWPALLQLLKKHQGETIAVVSHNVVNRVVLAELLGVERHKAKELRQANGGVNVICYQRGQPVVLTMNAIFHLHEHIGV